MPIKSISITLDKKRQLRFDFNAFCALEDELGISVIDLKSLFGFTQEQAEIIEAAEKSGKEEKEAKMLKVVGGIKFSNIRAALWAGLKHEDSSLTIEDVGNLLDMGNLALVFTRILEAYTAAFPDSEEEPEKKVTEPEQKSGPGKDISEKATI